MGFYLQDGDPDFQLCANELRLVEGQIEKKMKDTRKLKYFSEEVK